MYGWFEITVSADGGYYVVNRFAYNEKPGEPIFAGKTGPNAPEDLDNGYGAWEFGVKHLKLETYLKPMVCLENTRNIAPLTEGTEIGVNPTGLLPEIIPISWILLPASLPAGMAVLLMLVLPLSI